MTTLKISRFSRTREGYLWKDEKDLGRARPAIDELKDLLDRFRQRSFKGEPSALSLSTWSKGEMSGETWRYADGLLLEYMAGSEGEMLKRGDEIVAAATALGYGFYILDTCTRYGDRTWTVFWQFDDTVNKNQYVRLASVMAERMNVYVAADGIVSQTHLVHLHPRSSAGYSPGSAIPAKLLIHETRNLYQNMNPKRFEGKRPSSGAAVQLAKPAVTSSDTTFDELFSF